MDNTSDTTESDGIQVTRRYKDSIALRLNPGVIPDMVQLLDLAIGVLKATYPHSTLLRVDWTFCTTVAEVEAWELPHDCDDCRECKTLSIALLEREPALICLGTMFCEEPFGGNF